MSYSIGRIFSRLLRPRTLIKKYPFVSTRTGRKSGRRGRCRLEIELLEGRVVPATIQGTVYEDLDSNGVRNNGEDGISNWTVYLDLDRSGTLDAGEPSVVTNSDGDFTFSKLTAGTYRVAQVVQSGWEATSPASEDVTVTASQTATVDFFNFSGGDIVGTVWDDLNGDGVRATDPGTGAPTEPGLAGWTVYLDLDDSRTPDPSEPATVTGADGRYSFTHLPPDDYEVTVVLPAGWDISPGFDNRQTAGVVARTQVTRDFAFFSLTNGSIRGTVWNDVNANGVRDTDPDTGEFTDPPLADWTVFLDTNFSGEPDPGELTASTDADGGYSFLSLPEGDYEVTQVLPTGWDTAPGFDVAQTVSVFAGETSVADDFANFTVMNGSVRGIVWNDLNRNGVRDTTLAGAFTDPGVSGWTVYLDLNGDRVMESTEPTAVTDANGEYVFPDLQVGDYEVREVLPTGWEPTVGYGDSVGVTVFSGSESIAPDFANFNVATAVAGSVSGTVWNDLNGNGVRETNPSTGAFTDPGLPGRTVFVDVNGNGTLDAGEASAVSTADGSYTITGVMPGTVAVVEQAKAGWRYTAPAAGVRTIALRNAEAATGLDFGNWGLQDSAVRGVVFADSNGNGARDTGERGLDGITVYLDVNGNGSPDAGEPQTTTSADQFYTPAVDEAGTYSFTHLAAGTYTVRHVVPARLSATPAAQLVHVVTLAAGEDRPGVDCAAVFRPTEIHGAMFDDKNGDHVRDAGETGIGGVTVFVDLDRDDVHDDGEPTTVTGPDGSYTFTGLARGAYVVRSVAGTGRSLTYPATTGGIRWPGGASNPAVGNVTPLNITTSLAVGQSYSQTVSITLPGTGSVTDLVDVFLLFDDTGSFVNNSPIIRGAFPTIISELQAALPGIDLGFGVGRFEEYGNFAAEYATGRPFVLNQPIVAASTTGYMTAIQAALNRTTPGYGGDGPETDIEALYQLVTGLGFDGNNNGSVLDSGAAGLVSTQLNPGASGDVPSFASFQADAAGNVMAAAGNVGGGGFRAGALPVILLATDIGFAYQPKGETVITGVGGVSVPVGALTQTSRPTTPFNSGAGLQETVTGLNALGALVIGLGTNPQATIDPRQGLESLSKLTGAVNRSAATIANGTADPIAPGDPMYFQIASGFAGSVASGVVSAIQNAVTNVAVDITVQASDPRVRIVNHTGVRTGVGAGQTASFDIEFVGDGVPRRFDLQFVRSGTNVVLGSIPVVLGTPIPGDCYEFEDLEDGDIHTSVDFGSVAVADPAPTAPVVAVNGTAAPSATSTASRVTSLALTFNTAVTAIDPGAFILTRGATTLTSGGAVVVSGLGTNTLTLTFTGATGVESGSLADGVWTLSTDLSKVHNASGVTGTGTGTTGNIRRLYGDANGDGTVTLTDFGLFGSTFGKGAASPGYNGAFDFNGDGTITLTDFGAFGQRFGKGL